MADSLTDTVLKRRSAAKTGGFALVGVSLGLVLKVAFGFEPADAFFSSVQAVTDWFSGIKLWLDANPDVRGWLVGPVALGFLFLAISKFGWFRGGVLDRLFPDPPPFVRSDLDRARSRERMITLEGPPLPFVGREVELAELEELLGEPKRLFVWRALTGSSGIGKTRLGIEWLEAAKGRGWDVGIIDMDDPALKKEWNSRRPTALVIDEARRDRGDGLGPLMAWLAEAATVGKPVRVLVIDQVLPFVDVGQGEDRDRVKAAEIHPPLRLLGLGDAHVVALRLASGQTRLDEEVVIRESAGRPRAALILLNARDATSYAGALAEWADRFVPGLSDRGTGPSPSIAGALFLAALAGPVDTDVARVLFEPVDANLLQRFYQNESRASLEQRLPPLRPDDLADELLLRLFPWLDAKQREAAVDRMLADAPAMVEARLGGIWRERPDLDAPAQDDGPAAALRWLQARFDSACPDRVSALQATLFEAVDAVEEVYEHDAENRTALIALADIVSLRPFDPQFRVAEARGASLAISHCGALNDLESLERWGRRLMDLAGDERFAANAEIRSYQTEGAARAMSHFGAQRDFGNLQSWAGRLNDLVSDDRFATNATIRSHEAFAAANAMSDYGADGDFVRMEHWGNRLKEVAELECFAGNSRIRMFDAIGTFHAITSYGARKEFTDLERWGRHLRDIVEDNRYSASLEIRRQEAKSAANAIKAYGAAGDFECLEHWGKRLIDVAEDGRFQADQEIRLHEAIGAVNAIGRYGGVRDFICLERWGARLIDIAESEQLASDLDIRVQEGIGACNAISCYGEAEAFEGLERWGQRLIKVANSELFASNPQIRIQEAIGAVNAMARYGAVMDFVGLERWGQRLIDLANDKRFAADRRIRLREASGAYNAMLDYANAGGAGKPAFAKWRTRLAKVALIWPADAAIQERAAPFGVSAVTQASNNYPFGRPPAV